MEFSLLLGQQIISLFLMGMVGVILVRFRILKAEDSRVLSRVVVYVLMPCVTIRAFQIELTNERIKGFMLSLVVSIVIHIVFLLITWIFRKPLHLNAIEEGSMIFSNSANMIVPLIISILGQEWVFYSSPYILVWNIAFWTYGTKLLGKKENISFKKIFLHPNMIAIYLGIILFVFQIKIPYIVSETISSFSATIGPMSMLVVGVLIGSTQVKEMFTNKRIYMVSFFRLIAMPLLVVGLLYVIGVGHMWDNAKEILLIAVLQSAAPVGVAVTQMAQIYEDDARYASAINIISILFCIVTLPLIILLYNHII